MSKPTTAFAADLTDLWPCREGDDDASLVQALALVEVAFAEVEASYRNAVETVTVALGREHIETMLFQRRLDDLLAAQGRP